MPAICIVFFYANLSAPEGTAHMKKEENQDLEELCIWLYGLYEEIKL
jgi:hypothetical protein